MNIKIVLGGILAFLFLSSKSKAATGGGGGGIVPGGSGTGGGGTTSSGNGYIPFAGSEGTANESYLNGNYPRGIRNNNPGNIKFYTSNAWQGKIPAAQNTEVRRADGTPLFEQFVSYPYGVRAMIHLIKNSYIPSGRHTLRLIMADWAPDGGANYLNYVVGKTGKGADTIISATDETTIKKLVQAIGRYENDRKGNVPEAITDAQYVAGKNLL